MVLYVYSLKDVEHAEGKLYLIFEYVAKDLKKYMEPFKPNKIPVEKMKVYFIFYLSLVIFISND